MASTDPLTAALYERSEELIKLISQANSPIVSSLHYDKNLSDTIVDLKNISRSLGQYARTDRDFKYIGFVGHFSAGKSSTINSLLGANARETGLAPTDAEITLLTHPKNSGSILAAHSKGLLKVNSRQVDCDFLDHLFVVDTPGSGDPQIIEGMVRDFLPVCDLIIYVFSATSAFDQADLPVLRALTERLPFVPMKFAITRAGEFRRDENILTSHSNLDTPAKDKFLADLIARLRLQIPKREFDPADFYFVDNRHGFGVDELRASIMETSINIRELHSSKIAYFQSQLGQAKEYFASYLQKLISDLSTLQKKAEENRADYDTKVNFSVLSLQDFWGRLEKQIEARRISFNETFGSWSAQLRPENPNYVARWNSAGKVGEQFHQDADHLGKVVRESLMDLAGSLLLRHREFLKGRVKEFSKLSEFVDEEPPSLVTRQPIAEKYGHSLKVTINRAVRQTRAFFLTELEENVLAESEVFRSSAAHAARNDLLKKDEEAFADYTALITRNINEFLPIIQLFRTHVTSNAARELISRTGLGESLDVLDRPVDEKVQAASLALQITEKIFTLRDGAKKSLASSAESVVDVDGLVQNQFDRTLATIGRLNRAADKSDVAANDSASQEIILRAIEPSCQRIEQAFVEIRERLTLLINGELAAARNRDAVERTNFKVAWLKRIGGACAIAAVLAPLVFGTLWWAKAPDQIGVPMTIAIGLAIEVAAALLFWGSNRLFGTAGRIFPKLGSGLTEEDREGLITKIDNFRFFTDMAIEAETKRFGAEFSRSILNFLSADKEVVGPEYEQIGSESRAFFSERFETIRAYAGTWRSFLDHMNAWYRDEDAKRVLFSDLASNLKTDSIEPALNLFTERNREVSDFKERLIGIQF